MITSQLESILRTNRWARAPTTPVAARKGSTPRSRRRTTEDAASLLWMEARTRCPVRAAFTAVLAVSSSLISPTRIMSGSKRMIDRSPVGKSMPAARFTWIWFMPSNRYSMGSSTAMMLPRLLTNSVTEAYSVVAFPEPVGPETSNMP